MAPDPAPSWLRRHWVELALALVVLMTTAPLVQELKAQQASRLALTAAIWDDRSLRIDGYPIGVDRAERDGHVYSDKAPGQPVFAVPAYAAYRALGGEPATISRVQGNLGLWATSAWSSAVPAAVLVVLIRRAAMRVQPDAATAAAILTIGGSLLLPFASVLFGHSLAACLAFAGWYLVSRTEPSDRALLAAGLLLGASVLAEYTMVLAVAAVGALAVVATGRRAGWLVLGGAPMLAALLTYQWAAFGSPFAFSYASSSFGSASSDLGFEAQDPPLLDNAMRVLVGERGLLVVTPAIALALLGTVWLVRHGPTAVARHAHLAALGSALALVGVQVFWSNPTGGDSPGARYATAAAAFLAPGLAIAWHRWRRWTVALGGLSVLVMLAATWTNPLEARDSENAIGIWLRALFDGRWSLTLYEMAVGSWGRVLLPLGVGLAIVVLAKAPAGDVDDGQSAGSS